MPRRLWWLPLLLIATLLAVWWLVGSDDAPAIRVNPEQSDVLNARPAGRTVARPDADAVIVTPEPPVSAEVRPARDSIAASPRTKAPIAEWAPLPAQPTGALRPTRGSDTGEPDDDELAPIRAGLPTRRYSVTLRGRVESQPQFLDGMRVWADTLPGLSSGQKKLAGDLGDAGCGRLWPDSAPRGSALVDETGSFEIRVEVTGVDRKALLQALGQSTEGVEPGDFIARILLRIEAENAWSLGEPVLPLRPGQVVEGVVVATFARPIAQYRFEFPDGAPASHAAVTLRPMVRNGRSSTTTPMYGWTDRHGRLIAPLTGASDMTYTVSGSRGLGGLHVTTMERDWDEVQVMRAGDPRSHSVIYMNFQGEGAEPDAPPLVVEIHHPTLARLAGRAATVTRHHKITLAGRKFSNLRVESRGWGGVLLEWPEIPPGMCLVLDPVVFPAPRMTRIRVTDARGKPLAGVAVKGRALTEDGRDLFEHLPDGMTDEFGEVDLPVLPDRDYRFRFTRKGESADHPHSMRFQNAGPHEVPLPDP